MPIIAITLHKTYYVLTHHYNILNAYRDVPLDRPRKYLSLKPRITLLMLQTT